MKVVKFKEGQFTMVNSTVNGKKIGSAAEKDDKVRFNYCICGKKSKKRGLIN